jgi:hypothetical protein
MFNKNHTYQEKKKKKKSFPKDNSLQMAWYVLKTKFSSRKQMDAKAN